MGNSCCAQRGGSLDRSQFRSNAPKEEQYQILDEDQSNMINRVSSKRSGSISKQMEDFEQNSDNIFQINTKNKSDPTQVVEELSILWSRKQTLQDQALELQFPENPRKRKGKNGNKNNITGLKSSYKNYETLNIRREVTPTTYLSKNGMQSLGNGTIGSGQKFNKIITQSGTPLPFDQELSDYEQSHFGKIKQSASWNNLVDEFQSSIKSKQNKKRNTRKQNNNGVIQQDISSTSAFSSTIRPLRSKSEDFSKRLKGQDELSRDLSKIFLSVIRQSKKEKVAKHRKSKLQIGEYTQVRYKKYQDNVNQPEMALISHFEDEEIFHFEDSHQKRKPAPPTPMSKKKPI